MAQPLGLDVFFNQDAQGLTDRPRRSGSAAGAPLDEALVGTIASAEGLNPTQQRVMTALLQQESGYGRNSSTSVNGAQGAGQIIPDTFRRYAKPGERIDNPEHNLAVMARIVKDLGGKTGDDPARIATGYFSGEGNIAREGTQAWKNDAADGNGKRVSSYVTDVVGRYGQTPEAKPAQPAQAAGPDLAKAPAWADVVKKPEYSALSSQDKAAAKAAYFDYWIAPNGGDDALRQKFMANEDAAAPDMFQKAWDTASTIGEAVAGGVKSMFTKPESVMKGAGQVATPEGVTESLVPMTPQQRRAIENTYNASSPDKRLEMGKQPGFVGQYVTELNQRYGLIDQRAAPVVDRVDPRAEKRTQRLIAEGLDPEIARNMAPTQARMGVLPGQEIPGTIGATEYDFETNEAFKNTPGLNNPLVRGVAKGGLGIMQGYSGVGEAMADLAFGFDPSTGKSSKWARGKTEAIGDGESFLDRNLEGAISSIVQALPVQIASMGMGLPARLVADRAGVFVQSFGQEYSEGKSKGLDAGNAATRAGIFAAFEMVGESFGLASTLKLIKKSAQGIADPSDLRKFLSDQILKQVPGEVLTTTGQFLTDKIPAFGLNQQAGWDEYLKQVGDTITQTVMQGGIMAGGTTGVNRGMQFLRQGDTSSDEGRLAGTLNDAVDSSNWAKSSEQAGLDAFARGPLSSIEMRLPGVPNAPIPQIPGLSSDQVTPDGRLEVAPPASPPVSPMQKSADAIVEELANQAGIPRETVLPGTADIQAEIEALEARSNPQEFPSDQDSVNATQPPAPTIQNKAPATRQPPDDLIQRAKAATSPEELTAISQEASARYPDSDPLGDTSSDDDRAIAAVTQAAAARFNELQSGLGNQQEPNATQRQQVAGKAPPPQGSQDGAGTAVPTPGAQDVRQPGAANERLIDSLPLEENTEIQVIEQPGGITVWVFDKEAGQPAPGVRVFPKGREQDAFAYAVELAAKSTPKAPKTEKEARERRAQQGDSNAGAPGQVATQNVRLEGDQPPGDAGVRQGAGGSAGGAVVADSGASAPSGGTDQPVRGTQSQPDGSLRSMFDDLLAEEKGQLNAPGPAGEAPKAQDFGSRLQAVIDGYKAEGMADMARMVSLSPSAKNPTEQNVAFQEDHQRKLIAKNRLRVGAEAGTNAPVEPKLRTEEQLFNGAYDLRAQKVVPQPVVDAVLAKANEYVKQIADQGIQIEDVDGTLPRSIVAIKNAESSMRGLFSRYAKQKLAIEKGYKHANPEALANTEQELADELGMPVETIRGEKAPAAPTTVTPAKVPDAFLSGNIRLNPEIRRVADSQLAAGNFTAVQTKSAGEVRLTAMKGESEVRVSAFSADGKLIGDLLAVKGEPHNPFVDVDEGFRRQGIATEMYKLAESLGATIPSASDTRQVRTNDGRAFRAALAERGLFGKPGDGQIYSGAKENRPSKPKTEREAREQRASAGTTPNQFFTDLIRAGGISMNLMPDISGERGGKGSKGRGNVVVPKAGGTLFRKSGRNLDELATLMVELGYMTQADIDSEMDNGGINKLTDMIQSALRGEPVIKAADRTGQTESKFEQMARFHAEGEVLSYAESLGIDTAGKSMEQLSDEIDDAQDAAANTEAALASARDIEDVMTQFDIPGNEWGQENLIAYAANINPDAVEKAAARYDDDADFLRAIQEIVNEGRTRQAGQGRNGNRGSAAQEAGQQGSSEQGARSGTQEEGLLTQPTSEELRAREERQKQADKDRASAEKDADQRAKADAERDTFKLDGDGIQPGQDDMFGNSPAPRSENSAMQDAESSEAVSLDGERILTPTDDQVDDVAQTIERLKGDDGPVHHLFDAPTNDDKVNLYDKAGVKKPKGNDWVKLNGEWMTPAQAKAEVEKWKANAAKQGETRANSNKVVLSLFDRTGVWAQPWADAGYQVFTFDIQNDPEFGDINNFGIEYFSDTFGSFEGQDVYAILAACPCTDFTAAGNRWLAEKEGTQQMEDSINLVKQTLATIEYFKPSVWAIENPVGTIERRTGLMPWRAAWDPFLFGDEYTKKTLLWGRFNSDMPLAPVFPSEGSKMWAQYGGKSLKTKNARSETPEGFAYAFFQANNAIDHPAMAIGNKYDRLDRNLIEQAVKSGATEQEISDAVDDPYYFNLDDAAGNQALRDLIAEKDAPKEPPRLASNNKALAAAPDDTLVLIACSDTKVGTTTPVPLFDLYNGPQWLTLRKRIGSIPKGNVFALSGKYGLVPASFESANYNEQMTPDKADGIIRQAADLAQTLKRDGAPYTNVVIYGAGDYRRAFSGLLQAATQTGIVARDAAVRAPPAGAGIGQQRGALGEWLDEVNGAQSAPPKTEREAQQKRANKVEKPATPPQKDSPNLSGRKVTFDVLVEDTGQTAQVTVDAAREDEDLTARESAMRELIDCLRK